MAEICLRQVFLVAGGCTFGESCRFDGTGCSIGSLRQCWSTYSRYWDLKKLWISTGKCRKCHKWFDFYAFKGIRRWIMEVCAQVFWGKFGKKVRNTKKITLYEHTCMHTYIYIYSGIFWRVRWFQKLFCFSSEDPGVSWSYLTFACFSTGLVNQSPTRSTPGQPLF